MSKKKKESKNKFNENVEGQVVNVVFKEFQTVETNMSSANADFDSVIDILECQRTEKDYEWQTDVMVPEFASIHLTEASQWANQKFQARDFVEIYLEGNKPTDALKAQAAKKYINAMLNVRELFHYPKYMRARSINSTRGFVVAVCSWEQELKTIQVPAQEVKQVSTDNNGMPVYGVVKYDKDVEIPVVDRFHYEIIDPRNVFMNATYCYSIQQKEWVSIRSEMTFEQLKKMEDKNDLFNLSILKDWISQTETDTAKKIKRKEGVYSQVASADIPKQVKLFDVIERFGKIWAIVKESDEDGYPIKIEPGYDERGEILDKAEYLECIVTIAYNGSMKCLIRFQPTPFRTSKGIPYRPLVRGLCYIHPTKDTGMSDGLYAKELQILLDDIVNLSIDREKLVTLPTLKVRRQTLDDNSDIYFEPEHIMPCEQTDDIMAFEWKSNLAGGLQVANFAKGMMEQVESIYPTTMGNMPSKVETATAISGAESRTNLRSNYKSLTWEYTFETEFYWQMLQMGYQFMHPQTAIDIMGMGEDGKPLAQYFDPEEDFNYQAVESNVETEYNKDNKIKRIDQMIGRIANIPNPAIVPIIAFLIGLECELLGQEFSTVAPMIKKLAQTPNQDDKKEEGNAPKNAKDQPTQNQQGNPMSPQEQSVRGL